MSENVKKKINWLNIGLWAAQGTVASMFLMGSFMKLTVPIAELSKMMPWTGQVDPSLVTITGIFDGLGGLGLLLPGITKIKPNLTILAAIGCLALQICAFIFHASRGEAMMVGPMNIVLGALSAFIIWGRWKKAPLQPRAIEA